LCISSCNLEYNPEAAHTAIKAIARRILPPNLSVIVPSSERSKSTRVSNEPDQRRMNTCTCTYHYRSAQKFYPRRAQPKPLRHRSIMRACRADVAPRIIVAALKSYRPLPNEPTLRPTPRGQRWIHVRARNLVGALKTNACVSNEPRDQRHVDAALQSPHDASTPLDVPSSERPKVPLAY
jgi:hypothetical protein